ncbi:MAG: RND family transporter, partial [Gammaproteobacteria bacterium]
MNEFIAALYERLILRRPVIVLTILALIGLVFASGTRDFNLDASTDALLLENDKDLQAFRQLSMRYKTREFLFIAVVPPDDILSDATLERVGSLRDEIAALPEVLDIISLLDVPLVTNVPGSVADIATNFRTLRSDDVNLKRAREELTQSPIYQDLVASADGKVTALQVFLKPHPELPRLSRLRDQLLYKKAYEGLDPQE